MQQSWMHFGQSQRATASAWCCSHFLFYLGAWRSAKQQILAFIDTGELSHQNRSPPWEPRPACYSSCSPFLTEAATQDRSSFHCYAFTTAVVQLAVDVWNTSSARDLLFYNRPGFVRSERSFLFDNRTELLLFVFDSFRKYPTNSAVSNGTKTRLLYDVSIRWRSSEEQEVNHWHVILSHLLLTRRHWFRCECLSLAWEHV